jgi:ABC-type transport system substrate-binding protein
MRRKGLLIAVLPLLATGLVACESRTATPAQLGPYVRLADLDDVPTLDPAHGYDTRSWQFEEMIFDTLIDYDDEGRIVAELAAAWEVSADGLTYTFQLRPGVRFSNGRELTPADVRYSIERIVEPRTGSIGAEFFRGLVGAERCDGERPCSIDGIELLGGHALRFRLGAFDPVFLHKLTMPFAAVVPREEVEKTGVDFGRRPVGTGPFRLREWSPGRRILVVRNEDYFVAGIPKVAGVEMLLGVTDEVAWLKYDTGALDALELPPSEVPQARTHPVHSSRLVDITTMRTSYLGMNCLTPPFTDVRVRRAINHAVDREKTVRLLYGTAVAARSILPPNMPGHDAEASGYRRDPEAARRLLTEAGYGGGFATTLWVRSDPSTLRVAQGVQQDLAGIGVKLTIKAVAWGALLEAVRSERSVPLFLLGWEADFPDPSNFLEVLFHSRSIGSNNNTHCTDAELDRILDEAAQRREPSARFALLRRAERLIIDAAPWAFLYYPKTFYVLHPRLRDFRLHPFRPPRYDRVRLDDQAG